MNMSQGDHDNVYAACPVCRRFVRRDGRQAASELVTQHNTRRHGSQSVAIVVADLSFQSVLRFVEHAHEKANTTQLHTLHDRLMNGGGDFPFSISYEECEEIRATVAEAQYGSYVAYCDGSCRNVTSGRATVGGYIKNPRGDRVVEFSKELPSPPYSSTQAEYAALIETAVVALSNDIRNLTIKADAKTVIQQIQGEASTKAELVGLKQRVKRVLQQFDQQTLVPIPRHHNAAADELATVAYE